MVKKIAATLLALTMIFGMGVLTPSAFLSDTALRVSASDREVYGDYEYEVHKDNTIEILSYNGDNTEVNIPAEIDGKIVTVINDGSFYNCKNLTRVTIPDTVEIIGHFAFMNCTSLTDITIPDSVKELRPYSLQVCTSLTSITIPRGLTIIDEGVFGSCTGLTSVTIPANITSIGKDAFIECTSMKSITIPATVKEIGETAIGYSRRESVTKKLEDFKIYCYKNTAGEKYAIENGIEYECIDAGKRIGDVNGDGNIDIEDVSVLLNHVNGVKALSSEQTKRADVDGSGAVDIEDASVIINHINGMKSLY